MNRDISLADYFDYAWVQDSVGIGDYGNRGYLECGFIDTNFPVLRIATVLFRVGINLVCFGKQIRAF